MITKNKFAALLFTILTVTIQGQTNTASNSGSIGKCSVWDFPYTLYNTSGASQTVNNGVTVTVDQNRNIGAVNLTGTGAMEMSGANGITLSGNGSEINCRWDIPARGSFSMVNNNGNSTLNSNPLNTGAFFTAPYTGNYIWARVDSGWAASVSGAFLNADLLVYVDNTNLASSIFYQDQAGSCGSPPGSTNTAPYWVNYLGPAMTAGATLSYRAGTGYNNAPGCTNTTFNFTIGKAIVVYDN